MKVTNVIVTLLTAATMLISCSTTRSLHEGEMRLAKNELEVTNDNRFSTSDLRQYIKQQPNSYFLLGWNPFLNLYNWSGENPSGGLGRAIRKIGVAPVVFDSSLVTLSRNNIKNHLEYIGYYDSKVSSTVTNDKRKVNVKYLITLGKRYPISSITFSIPSRGDFPKDFYRDTSRISIKRGSYLSEKALEKESERSASYFNNRGYYGFNKNYYSFEADTLSNPDSARLEMRINEYTRNETSDNAREIDKYHIKDVTISHPKSFEFSDKVLKKLNTIKPGDLYRARTVNNTYSRLSSIRSFSSVNIAISKADTNLVNCDISITPAPTRGFKANIEGSSNSSGLIGISPQLSVFNRNMFKRGEWLNLSLLGNFQFKPNSTTSSEELGATLSLSFPKFLGLPYSFFKGPSIPRTEVNASYNFQNRPEYTRNIISTSYGYSGNFKGRLFYQVYPVQLSVIRLFNLDQSFFNSLSEDPFLKNAYRNHFDLGMGSTTYYTTNSDVNPTSSYHYFRFQFDISGNLLSLFNPALNKGQEGHKQIWNTDYSQYVRGEISLGKTLILGKNNRHALAMRVLAGAGYAYGNSSVLPYEKQFFSGGANSLRGWQSRAIGPGTSVRDTTFSIPSQTGDMKLEANIEYRFPLFWKLAGAMFVDAGNVWTLSGNDKDAEFRFSNLANSIAADWGLGIRLDLNFILLRIDMGIKLRDPSRENKWVQADEWLKNNGYAVHIGVGYPF